MSNNTMSEEEKHLLAVFSANFNDGEPIETRVGSSDMKNVSVIVEFIKDYVAPYVVSKQIEARIDELSHVFRIVDGRIFWQSDISLAMPLDERIVELRKQQDELK